MCCSQCVVANGRSQYVIARVTCRWPPGWAWRHTLEPAGPRTSARRRSRHTSRAACRLLCSRPCLWSYLRLSRPLLWCRNLKHVQLSVKQLSSCRYTKERIAQRNRKLAERWLLAKLCGYAGQARYLKSRDRRMLKPKRSLGTICILFMLGSLFCIVQRRRITCNLLVLGYFEF